MGLFLAAAQAAETAAEHGAEHGAEAAGGHGATGLPQLAIETFPSQIVWLVITLIVLYMIFSRIALPGIGGVIEERHDAIEDDLDRAAELRRKADDAEKSYQAALAAARAKAQAIAAEARAEIQKEVDAATAKADAEISARAAEGEKRIAEIRASAMEAVEEVATDTAQALVSSILPAAADEAAVKSAVAAKLKG